MKMKTAARKRTPTNTPKSFVSRCNQEISDSVGELCTQFPNLLKSIGQLVVSLSLILSNMMKIIVYLSLKALVEVPNGIEEFLSKSFANNKNGRIIGWAVRIAIISFLFFLFLGIVSTVTFPIGKLATLNLSVRNCESSEALVGLLEQKNQIYSSGGITGWIACKTAIEKILFWVLSVYSLLLTGLTISKLSVSAVSIASLKCSADKKRKRRGYIMV